MRRAATAKGAPGDRSVSAEKLITLTASDLALLREITDAGEDATKIVERGLVLLRFRLSEFREVVDEHRKQLA